jgi:hypothetical protein
MNEFQRLQSIIDKKRTPKRSSSSLNPEKRFKLKDAFLESLKEDEKKEEEKKEDKGSSSMDTAQGRKKTGKKKVKSVRLENVVKIINNLTILNLLNLFDNKLFII